MTAIQLHHSPITCISAGQNNNKCFDAGRGNLYPDTRPWYIQSQT